MTHELQARSARPMQPPDAPMHICISGDLGSGKSSVASIVAEHLGFALVSTGDIQRGIAQELRVSTLGANLLAERDPSIDDRVDSVTKEVDRQATSPLIFDSRMAWWFVRRALKVRLIVDPEVAVERILGRTANAVENYRSLAEAREQVAARYASETARFLARYGVNVAHLSNFDLVVDSSDLTAAQIAAEVVIEYTKHDRGAIGTRLLVSPRRVVPAFAFSETLASDPGAVSVAYARPFLIALAGEQLLRTALARGDRSLAANLVGEDDDVVVADVAVRSLVDLIDLEAVAAWANECGANVDTFLQWRQGLHIAPR